MDAIYDLIQGASEDHVPPSPTTIVQGDFRPRVVLPGDGRLLDDFAADLVKELRDKPIFNHGGMAMVIDEETNKLRPIGQSALRSWLENPKLGNVVCMGRVGRGKESFMQDQTLSEEGAKGLLVSHRFLSGIRKISRVNTVRMPVKREKGGDASCQDGSIKYHAPSLSNVAPTVQPAGATIELLPEGYDEASRIFTNKTTDFDQNLDLESAKKHFEFLLADTAFNPIDKERSTSAILSMMLAPFCDSLFGRFTCRPAFIVQANQEGAGKTTAITMALAPIFGPVVVTAAPEKGNEGELAKLLNSIAQAGAPYLFLDNWVGKIQSGALAAFITASALSARVLGTSYLFDADKHCLVFISAIRSNVVGEMRRRSVFIDLFVEEARSEDRKINRPIDEGDILNWRSDILASLWALVREWRDADCPKGSLSNASFNEWGRTIGGILEHAGYQSPLLPPPQAVDERLDSMTKVVKAASLSMLTNEIFIRPSELIEIAREAGAFTWLLDEEPPDTSKPQGDKEARSERRAFGFYCEQFKGRTFTFDSQRINFDSIGDGKTKQYRFTKRN